MPYQLTSASVLTPFLENQYRLIGSLMLYSAYLALVLRYQFRISSIPPYLEQVHLVRIGDEPSWILDPGKLVIQASLMSKYVYSLEKTSSVPGKVSWNSLAIGNAALFEYRQGPV